jgi:hypothetical protein
VFLDVGTIEAMTEVIERLATLEVSTGDPERAAVLLGSAEAIREEIGATGWESDRLRSRTARETVERRLGAEAFGRAVARGRAMAPHEVVAFALEGGATSMD